MAYHKRILLTAKKINDAFICNFIPNKIDYLIIYTLVED